MGKTFAEKVLGRAAGYEVRANEVVTVEPDVCMSHDNGGPISRAFKKIGVEKVKYPERICFVLDHAIPAPSSAHAVNHKEVRAFAAEQGIPHLYDITSGGGVCHQKICEEGYALPGLVMVGSDSHTCTYGAYGAFSTGIGRTEMAAVWATGKIWFKVPESMKVTVAGKFNPGVSTKDFILKLIGDVKADGADYMSVEFHGQGIEDMSIAERMTICNMGVEFGAKNAVCKPDQKVLDAIKGKEKYSNWECVWADEDAVYAKEVSYDLGDIVPCVAKPHTVDNWAPIDEVKGTNTRGLPRLLHQRAHRGPAPRGRNTQRTQGRGAHRRHPRVVDSLPPGDARGNRGHAARRGLRDMQPGLRPLHGQPRGNPRARRDCDKHREQELQGTHGRQGQLHLPRQPDDRSGVGDSRRNFRSEGGAVKWAKSGNTETT